ncbi:MAG: glycosyltransferase [Anaerolineaceae bacterium]|nr:glycosyltransferase [Anaerolineaceae bacterium]
MKIAMLGTRGIPASYSGFETCVEQLSKRLVARGHQVTVYCRSTHIDYSEPYYMGVRLIRLSTIQNKYLDTIIHSFLSSIHSLFQGYDVCLYFIAGNSPVTWIPRIADSKTILNVDGLDWKREKWPRLAKKYIQLAEFLATVLPNTFLTDSNVVQSYYQERYNSKPIYIPYGSEVEMKSPGNTLQQFELEAKKYILFVGRLVPENYVHHLVQAFKKVSTDMKLVIVGDAPYVEDYKKELYKFAEMDPRIVFTGYVFGDGYYELGSNAYLFVETSGVGGTHPAIVEAMAFGNCVIVNDTPENLETIADAGFSYDGKNGAASLQKQLDVLISNPEMVSEYGTKARLRAENNYSWEAVTDRYEQLFRETMAT